MTLIVSGALALLAATGGFACDPSTPDMGAGPADAGADRIILMAASGGVSCLATSGSGGAPAGPPTIDSPLASGGAGGGGAVGSSSGGRGGTAVGTAGTRGGAGGMAGVVGHGGIVASGGDGGAQGGRTGGAAGAAGDGGAGGAVAGAGGVAPMTGGGGMGGGGVTATGGMLGTGGVPASGGQVGSGGAGAIPPPAAGELAIVELLINPAGTDTGREWIEVVNRAAHALDLASLHIADAVNDAVVDFAAAGTTILLPGARAVLIQSPDPTKNGGVTLGVASGVFGGSFGTRVSLNNDADTITVCTGACASGVVIDQFAWDASLGSTYDDHALSIDDGGRRCPAPTPFGDAGSFGSPGAENPPCP